MRAESGLSVFAVTADIEPQITGQGKQPRHQQPVDPDGMLGGVGLNPAIPVGFVTGGC